MSATSVAVLACSLAVSLNSLVTWLFWREWRERRARIDAALRQFNEARRGGA